jgi:hypothetical protein
MPSNVAKSVTSGFSRSSARQLPSAGIRFRYCRTETRFHGGPAIRFILPNSVLIWIV